MNERRSMKEKTRILVVFGTRPEAIKMAPLVTRLKSQSQWEVALCVTAQHREMLDQVLKIFELKPDFDLDLMEPAQSLPSVASRMLVGLHSILNEFRPKVVFVHGDTLTTLCASLAAYFHQVPVAHVEAGLRTGNIYSPWPEEGNRKIVTGITRWHFAPTEHSRQNLVKENVDPKTIHITGNTVIDALIDVTERLKNNDAKCRAFERQFAFAKLNKPLLLVTGHRRESFGIGLKNICLALQRIANSRPDLQIAYPVHLNPSVEKPVFSLLSEVPNIHLMQPLDYEAFVFLMNRATIILTDSGGIQEEAPSLGKPVLVMRETTERPEALDAGTVKLTGTSQEIIYREVIRLLDDNNYYRAMNRAQNPYGDGKACQRIIDILEKDLR